MSRSARSDIRFVRLAVSRQPNRECGSLGGRRLDVHLSAVGAGDLLDDVQTEAEAILRGLLSVGLLPRPLNQRLEQHPYGGVGNRVTFVVDGDDDLLVAVADRDGNRRCLLPVPARIGDKVRDQLPDSAFVPATV